MIQTRRIYEEPGGTDSCRILVDRIWPRGISKEKAAIDEWMKDVAPSGELRKWFGHDPAKWGSFQKKYFAELREKTDLIIKIKELEKERGSVTLLYAARDEEHNNARALLEFLNG